ncbi:MAG: hypothetical protein KTR15_00810 [Phycisphaeraceae bacterium]|nr:hypothetical protein [Phycisphaeraceae bacterium]
MQLSELTNALDQHPDAGLAFVLPDDSTVAQHFHVTEVGRVRKDFIDCGGTARRTDSCVLQVWVANDIDHRLIAGKLGKIIGLGKDILQDADLPVEIEYDVGVITQFAVKSLDADDKQITLKLAGKHTACLAPDRCGVDEGASDSGCCSPDDSVVSLGVNQGKCC